MNNKLKVLFMDGYEHIFEPINGTDVRFEEKFISLEEKEGIKFIPMTNIRWFGFVR